MLVFVRKLVVKLMLCKRFILRKCFFLWRNSVDWVFLVSMSNYVSFVSVLCFGR